MSTLADHLNPGTFHPMVCDGCGLSVKQAASGKWYITLGHPGFNSPPNNAGGYISAQFARSAIAFYRGRSRRQKG